MSETIFPMLKPAELAQHLNLKKVLAIFAHPDDVDFGASSTIAGLTAAGVEVSYLVLTDGDAGGFEAQDPGARARRRQEEQRAAAKVVGVDRVEFMGLADGFVEVNHDVMRGIVQVMRQVRPDAVIAQHPERNWESAQAAHPDHMAGGEAVVRATYPAVENPFAYPELAAAGLEAWKIRWLLLMAAPPERLNLRVDVTETADKKIEALLKHESQHPDIGEMKARVRGKMEANHPEPGGAAEMFHAVAVNDDTTFAGF